MTELADGEWHRLHPATPLLKGGIALIAILGIVVANLRERLVEWLIPGVECPPGVCEEDPISIILERYLLLALLGIVVVIIVVIGLFWLSWRMHTFRVTGEVVEVRSGVLFRSHRKARLDRIQGINIARSLFARIFGAARLEISAAGSDANVQLAYLSSANADGLRAEILARASGLRAREAADAVAAAEAVAAGAPVGTTDAVRANLAELARPVGEHRGRVGLAQRQIAVRAHRPRVVELGAGGVEAVLDHGGMGAPRGGERVGGQASHVVGAQDRHVTPGEGGVDQRLVAGGLHRLGG